MPLRRKFVSAGWMLLVLLSAAVVMAQVPPPNLPPPGGFQPIPNYTGPNAGLQFRNAINDRFSGQSPVAPKIAAVNFANLPAEHDGLLLYCTDCQKAIPCASGGAGAWAFGHAGGWSCMAPGNPSLAGDAIGPAATNQVTATHLGSPLPKAQGGTGNARGADLSGYGPLSALDYGVDNSGATDTHVALQNYLNTRTNLGDVDLWFGPGVYKLGTTSLNLTPCSGTYKASRVHLHGSTSADYTIGIQNGTATIIEYSGTGNALEGGTGEPGCTGYMNVEIDHIAILQSGAANTGTGIMVQGSQMWSIHDAEISNFAKGIDFCAGCGTGSPGSNNTFSVWQNSLWANSIGILAENANGTSANNATGFIWNNFIGKYQTAIQLNQNDGASGAHNQGITVLANVTGGTSPSGTGLTITGIKMLCDNCTAQGNYLENAPANPADTSVQLQLGGMTPHAIANHYSGATGPGGVVPTHLVFDSTVPPVMPAIDEPWIGYEYIPGPVTTGDQIIAGGIHLNGSAVNGVVGVPNAPTVSVVCTVAGGETCNAPYTYYAGCSDVNGKFTTPSSPTAISNGPVTPNQTNYAVLSGNAPQGCVTPHFYLGDPQHELKPDHISAVRYPGGTPYNTDWSFNPNGTSAKFVLNDEGQGTNVVTAGTTGPGGYNQTGDEKVAGSLTHVGEDLGSSNVCTINGAAQTCTPDVHQASDWTVSLATGDNFTLAAPVNSAANGHWYLKFANTSGGAAGAMSADSSYVGLPPMPANNAQTVCAMRDGSDGKHVATGCSSSVNGVSYGASPSTNTVAVVTAPNTTTYEQVPDAAIASAYSGVGSPCAAGQAVTALSRNGGPTCSAFTGGTILDQHVGNPYYSQAAAQSTVYTPYSYSVAGGTLGTAHSIDMTVYGDYINSVSSDTPQWIVQYGGVNIVSSGIPSSLGSSANPRAWRLFCHLASAGATGTHNGYCALFINGVPADGSWGAQAQAPQAQSTISVDSTTTQALRMQYNDPSSANSTIRVKSAVTVVY